MSESTTGQPMGACCPVCKCCPCQCSNKTNQPTNSGWECPKCGSVYGPQVRECLNCNRKVW